MIPDVSHQEVWHGHGNETRPGTGYVADLEEQYLDSSPEKPLLWKHYIDDALRIWLHGAHPLKLFVQGFSGLAPSIKFTYEYSQYNMVFLDMYIYKPPLSILLGSLPLVFTINLPICLSTPMGTHT